MPPRRGRGRWIVLGAAVLVLAGGAAAAWQLLRRPPAALDPPMPRDIQQPEVRAAIEAARQNVLQKPRSADAWGLLGMTLEAQLYEPEADRCFAEAARLDPSDPRWPYFRGLYAQKYDPARAVPFFREALTAAGASPEEASAVRLRLAETLLEERRLDEAEPLFQEEARRRPGEARAVYGLGLIAVARGDQVTAQKRLTVAAADPNTRKKATAQLAALARAHGDDAGAAACEKEWAKLPNDPTAWPDPLVEQVARLQVASPDRSREVGDLERQGRYQEAADIYLQQIDEDPNNAAAHTGAGLDLFRLGQYDRGFGLLREGARLDPASSAAHYSLAQALFTWAEKGWQEKPGDAALLNGFREAAEQAQRAAELKPDHAQACLLWGMSLKYLGKPAEAVAPLRKGVAARPGSLELQLALGEALMESGQTTEAETHLENARRIDPNDPRLIRDLERLHR